MKYLIFAFFCVSFTLSVSAVPFLSQYTNSLDQWNTLNPSSYSFVVYSSSEVVDIEIKTTIEVTDNVVTKRSFWKKDNFNYSNKITTWEESTPETINSHKEGFVAITLGDVYYQCRTNILAQDPRNFNIFFEAKNNGLISKCGFSAMNCEDDCFRGVKIESINY